MINILIADDHAIVREGLKQIIAEETDMKVTGEASNADEVYTRLTTGKFNIIVLDINMPGKSGLDVLKDIKIQYPDIPVLILSMYGEDQYGIRALKAGASGYLKKVSAPDEFALAIRKIAGGGRYVSASLAENLANAVDNKYHNLPHEVLSDREFDVMCRIASGESAENISESLSISIHTYYSYRNRILEKMKMKTNVELTQYVIKNKLIQ